MFMHDVLGKLKIHQAGLPSGASQASALMAYLSSLCDATLL
jgi:hypothetical protein